MKKIIVVTRALSAGGSERVIVQIINYLANKGNKCRIITTDKSNIAYELNPSIDVVEIGRKSDNKIVDRLRRYLLVRRRIIDYRPDVVFSIPEDTGIYVVIALIGTHLPVVVSERNNPWIMPDALVTRALRHIAYPLADGIVFQTETAKSFFKKSIQKKGRVIQNPVEENRIPKQYNGRRRKAIVNVGRLTYQKNQEMLIKAFAMFANKNEGYSLEIYGVGEEIDNLKRIIKQLRLEQTVFIKGQSKDVLYLINDAAMFVLSSRYEGMPNVLMEAMCMGMPVISTDCPSGGPGHLIKDEINGLLVEVENPTKMAEAMERMTDPKFAKWVSDNAYSIRNEMTADVIFEEWENYLFSFDNK